MALTLVGHDLSKPNCWRSVRSAAEAAPIGIISDTNMMIASLNELIDDIFIVMPN